MAFQDAGEPTATAACGAPGQGTLERIVCLASEGWPWTGAGALLLVAAAVAGILLWRRYRARQAQLPLLVFPTSGAPPVSRAALPEATQGPVASVSNAAEAPASDRNSDPASDPAAQREKGRRRKRRRAGGTEPPDHVEVEGSAGSGERAASVSTPAAPAQGSAGPGAEPAAGPGPEPGSRHAEVAPEVTPEPDPFAEGTLQLLPGWLETVSGEAPSSEIRFVRVPGAPPEVTFGRQPGPEFRHVQLRSPAVSRLHARMVLVEEGWTLRNESGTNPTVVNGTPLDSASGDVLLVEGDRIEMGDVVFVYHGARGRDALSARSGWHTDQGPRPTNQDAVLVRKLTDGREIAVVCDGMGSHVAGGKASHAAIEAFVAELEGGGELEDAVHAAQEAVRRVATAESDPDGVGTTLVAVLRDRGAYRVVNVGDSRAYRLVKGGLRRLTRDHSYVEEAVASGRMSAEEARRSPLRNAVTRSLGESPPAEADYFGPFEIERGERLLLSSDGLHGVLDDETIAQLLGEDLPVPDLPRRLVRAALEAGTRDNVSVAALAFH
jgi:serine/threonine protein phosphatase PrpC